jgi:1,4-alpha-glucan branching enzyme
VVYEIYVRSFTDSDSDGVGDLPGIMDRMPYLRELGYDVVDPRSVDPVFGTLDAFDELLNRAHGLGVRVIIDVVPNHTSDQHPWFRAACAAPAGDGRGSGTSCAMAAGRMAPIHRMTGSQFSADPPGRDYPTGSDTCTCSPPSSPT